MKTLLLLVSLLASQVGSYTNPIMYSDYSDPDIVSVDGEFWMTASSFNCVPALQVLHSYDLVNWEIVNSALPRLTPEDNFKDPKHGCGVWAPCIRYAKGQFWIFWGDPDYGIYQVHTADPYGKWSEPTLIIPGKGLIDATAVFTEDGKVFLAHAWANSRAGFNGILNVCELDGDCTHAIGEQVLVIDGSKTGDRTIEGPKFYQRGEYFYIFAPAGGVAEGWQLVYRSKSPYGPYEKKVVLNQGSTDVNGPHQGGWATDAAGDCWFMHFQDRGGWGRIVHLQPMKWTDDGWCTMGEDYNNDGVGEPVKSYRMPAVKEGDKVSAYGAVSGVCTKTDFTHEYIPRNWQWHANPEVYWAMPCPAGGFMHLKCVRSPENWKSLFDTPNLLLEKIVGPQMELKTKLEFKPDVKGDRAGIVVMGRDYSTLEFVSEGKEVKLQRRTCIGADKGAVETVGESVALPESKTYTVYVKVIIEGDQPVCEFFYSLDGKRYHKIGDSYTARQGVWIGAKIGFFAISPSDMRARVGGWLEVY